MAKKSRMKQEEVERITGERVYFEDTLCLLDGLKVEEENGKRFTELNDELVDDDIITIKFDKVAFDRIKKYSRNVLAMRGIKTIDAVDETDPDVQELLKKWKKRTGRRGTRNKQQRDEEARIARQFVETVISEHRPQYVKTFFQVVVWGLIYEDFFSVAQGRVEYRIDVDIPEEYWVNIVRQDDNPDAELDAMLMDYKASTLIYDRTNPLELMLAVTSSLIEDHEEFGEALGTYFDRVVVALQIMGGASQFDDAGFLNSTLDELLPEPMDESDNARGKNNSGRSSGSDGKAAGTSGRKSGKPKDEQVDEGVTG